MLCRILRVNRSGYYRWKAGLKVRKQRWPEIDEKVKVIWSGSKSRYGAPKIRQELLLLGIPVSRQRVQRRMKALEIRSKYRKKYRPVTTTSNHKKSISPNLLNREFESNRLGEKWVSDITYLKCQTRWVYLTTVMDLADHQIVGWSLSRDMRDDTTTLLAFSNAVERRNPLDQMIFHSDRGSQYASDDFRKLLESKNVRQSMSRKGNCWDNAVAEAFFRILKAELPENYTTLSFENLKSLLFDFIEIWYNRKRIHSTLGYFTPAQMELILNRVA